MWPWIGGLIIGIVVSVVVSILWPQSHQQTPLMIEEGPCHSKQDIEENRRERERQARERERQGRERRERLARQKELERQEKRKREEKKIQREKLRKSSPVCPNKEICDKINCKNKSDILCTQCNIHLCSNCNGGSNSLLSLKNCTHCKTRNSMQKIEPLSIICEINNKVVHKYDCFLKPCKHIFHKDCLVESYKHFKNCLHCLQTGKFQEFTLDDISTKFFDPNEGVADINSVPTYTSIN